MENSAPGLSAPLQNDLSSSESPYPFQVTITTADSSADEFAYSFEVNGTDPSTGLPKTCIHILKDKTHHSFTTFYEKLSHEFGMRTPQNKKETLQASPKLPYRALITENIAPGILYGYGDPAVIQVNEKGSPVYYVVSTSNDAPDSFPIVRSRNLIDWEFIAYVFPEGNKPEWAADGENISDFWAPEIHRVGKNYKVYFVARDKNRELCIGVATSERPAGPYVYHGEPIIRGNVIDPHVYVEDDQKAYLLWKEDNNEVWPKYLNDLLYQNPSLIHEIFKSKEDQLTVCFIQAIWPWIKSLEPMERFLMLQVFIEIVTSDFKAFFDRLKDFMSHQIISVQQQIESVLAYMKTPVYAQLLSEDGTRLEGERIKIIENDLDWEAHLVEGMWVTKSSNKYYLFYAGNDFSTDRYGIGVAISDHILGPYNKMQQPFLQSTSEWSAPGHPSVATDPNGNTQLLLHAYFPGKAGYKQFRALLAVRILLQEDGVRISY